MPDSTNKHGLVTALMAFAIWGTFPAYWRLLGSVTPFELLLIRLVLTSLTCLALLPLRGSWQEFFSAWKSPQTIRISLIAALLLSGNWFAFMWAVTSGNIIESSLGYFLCPIATVLMGRFILKEKMRGGRWVAVLLASTGVTMMILIAGKIPLAALIIAVTWSSYGLLKKQSSLGPVVSLGLESTLLAPVSCLALLWLAAGSQTSLADASGETLWILSVAGLVTTTPLLLFAYAAPRIRLGTLGMGQYIVPSCHFALAFIYGEKLGIAVLLGFALIWLGLIIYALSGSRYESD